MSFLQQIAIKEKIDLASSFFYEYVWVKSSLYLVGISLIFSLIIVQFSIPEFYASATLRETQPQSQGGGAPPPWDWGCVSLNVAEA